MALISDLRSLWEGLSSGTPASSRTEAAQRRQTEAFCAAASTLAAQTGCLIELFAGIWAQGSKAVFQFQLMSWIGMLEHDGDLRSRFQQGCRSMLGSLNSVSLFAEAGIPAQHALIREITSRFFQHWQDKDALCLEVMGYLHGLDEEPPVFDSGDLRADLIAQLQYQPAVARQALREKMTPHMIAYASRNRAMGAVWRARVVEPARIALTNIIKRGEKRGILRRGIDPEVGIALLLGPMIYRRIFVTKAGGKAPKEVEIQVVDAFLAAFGTEKSKPSHR